MDKGISVSLYSKKLDKVCTLQEIEITPGLAYFYVEDDADDGEASWFQVELSKLPVHYQRIRFFSAKPSASGAIRLPDGSCYVMDEELFPILVKEGDGNCVALEG